MQMDQSVKEQGKASAHEKSCEGHNVIQHAIEHDLTPNALAARIIQSCDVHAYVLCTRLLISLSITLADQQVLQCWISPF